MSLLAEAENSRKRKKKDTGNTNSQRDHETNNPDIKENKKIRLIVNFRAKPIQKAYALGIFIPS